ncbi:MAG: DUF1343 domain-containing protein, partial [Rhodothermales bacterium]
YPGAGLFEGTSWSEGRGTMTPFLNVGAPDIDAGALADSLNAEGLPGVRFEATTFTPQSIPVMAESPKLLDIPLRGIRIVVTESDQFEPVATGVHLVSAAYRFTPEAARNGFFNSRWMRIISGGTRMESMITEGVPADSIVAAWGNEVAAFVEMRRKYLLY